MSCQEFKRVFEELAGGRLLETAARDEGLAHAAVCVECAARLMEARSIGAGLHVAARAEVEEAPARVRQTLLAAFAEQHRDLTEQRLEDVAPSNVIALPARRAARWWGAAAVAAAVLLLLGLTSWVRFSKDDSQAPSQQLSVAPAAPAQPPVENREAKPGILVGNEVVQKTPLKKSPAHMSKAARGLHVGGQRESATVAQSGNNEYLPLTYLADATAMESGTVVRVELSRSALISLGVPVEIDRSDELLKADVVLGDDGVARAIRLVR
ncbi:MAG: hypothetical protein ACJ74T_03610 [Pyrinomonadaceae bacterium]